MPATVVHLLFGEMGDELLLSSTRVLPERLLENNYRFIDADFQKTLYALIRNS
jgi:NAD dependent epimerase/dehydratase family enzyme